jgi:hypothetical protein
LSITATGGTMKKIKKIFDGVVDLTERRGDEVIKALGEVIFILIAVLAIIVVAVQLSIAIN